MSTALTCELGITGAAQANSAIQVPRVLSALNHRLYRQHMMYTARVNLNTDANVSKIDVYALAPTWYVVNSLRAAKRVHDDAMKEERALVGQARWYDFRINEDMPSTSELMPRGLDRTTLANSAVSVTGSEYTISQIHDVNGANKEFRLVFPSDGSGFNVFEEYDAMGNVSDAPQTPAAGGYDNVHSDVDTPNMEDLLNRGNAPPYDTDTWNVVWVKVGELYQSAAGAQSRSTGYFEAPLGLIYMPGLNADNASSIRLEVAAGKYKGVKAVPL